MALILFILSNNNGNDINFTKSWVEEYLYNGKVFIFRPDFYSGEVDKHSFIGLFLRVKWVFSASAMKF